MSFRHTSKSSSRSSSPRKSSSNPEESSKLYSELESLKQAVVSLKNSVESRDVAIGKLAREKEKLYVELKGAQRTSRNLRQQLVDERDIHSKEKQYLVEEIARLSKKEEFDCYSVQHYSNTYESIILLLQDNKGVMDNLFEKILRFSTVSQGSKKYLKLLRMNIKLHYENTQLKMSLTQNNRSIKDRETEGHEQNYHDSIFRGSRNTIAAAEGSEICPGVTLTSSHQTETWDPEAKVEYPRNNKLLIRLALLGPDAKPDEFNVVQVETMSLQDSIKIPVAILKVGETRQARLDLEFPDAPVTFTLIQGSGPVHLIGQHLLGALVEEFEDMEEMEEEMIDEEEGDDSQFKDDDEEEGEPKGKKAKMSNNAKGKAPSPKKNAKK
ncbi:hypothetical protein MSG28_014365 [Choristoneura fumiferana]|uniref:Uncharacterized protein n=1 Tax=Choristoneura fumiferana TaxID=7141 RepID=A0ACC0JH38_CHOFU|nr:hypothetical protein MSG28_014365 [Choristoneura fumiferana]